MHPSITPGWLRECLKSIPDDTPTLDPRAAFLLACLYRLEAYSAENAILLRAAAATARSAGWSAVDASLAHPQTSHDISQFRGLAAHCLEEDFDHVAESLMAHHPENTALTMTYALQFSEFRDFDLGKLVGWLKEHPNAVER